MITSLLAMVDQELEDFNEERKKHKGLKNLVDFETSLPEDYTGSNFSVEIKPKFKKKIVSSVYIKNDKNKGQLF